MSKNWQQRGEHNELEASQVQVSSLIVLTHVASASDDRCAEVVDALMGLNPAAEIVTLDELSIDRLPELAPLTNTGAIFDHRKVHWASCSVDLPPLPSVVCIDKICAALPETIMRVKGCTRIGDEENYTFFERVPDGTLTVRPFFGEPITGPKLPVVGPGSDPLLLGEIVNASISDPLP